MKRYLLIPIAVLAVAAGGFWTYRHFTSGGDKPQLTTAAVTRGEVVDSVDSTGTLQAVTTVQVGSQISGTIKSLHADFNSEVRKGQVIAELDPSLLQTQVDQGRATIVKLEADVDRAQVQFEDARLKYQRAQELFQRQLLARNDLETAESTMRTSESAVKSAQAQVVQARASLNQDQVNIAHTVIRAPIDGIVISRNVDVGQTVAASMQAPTLFVIARDLARMQVSANVDESDIGRIRPGEHVTFRVDAYNRETFEGTVSQVRLQPVVEQNVVSYVTIIDVPNPDLKLKPGMTATVTLEVARADDVLRVPNAALRFRPTPEIFAALGQQAPDANRPQTAERREARNAPVGTTGTREGAGQRARVWVLQDGKLRSIPVRTGITDGAMTAVVSSDLPENAQVVTGVTQAGTATSSTTSSPLLPFGGRGRGGAARQTGGGQGGQRGGR